MSHANSLDAFPIGVTLGGRHRVVLVSPANPSLAAFRALVWRAVGIPPPYQVLSALLSRDAGQRPLAVSVDSQDDMDWLITEAKARCFHNFTDPPTVNVTLVPRDPAAVAKADSAFFAMHRDLVARRREALSLASSTAPMTSEVLSEFFSAFNSSPVLHDLPPPSTPSHDDSAAAVPTTALRPWHDQGAVRSERRSAAEAQAIARSVVDAVRKRAAETSLRSTVVAVPPATRQRTYPPPDWNSDASSPTAAASVVMSPVVVLGRRPSSPAQSMLSPNMRRGAVPATEATSVTVTTTSGRQLSPPRAVMMDAVGPVMVVDLTGGRSSPRAAPDQQRPPPRYARPSDPPAGLAAPTSTRGPGTPTAASLATSSTGNVVVVASPRDRPTGAMPPPPPPNTTRRLVLSP